MTWLWLCGWSLPAAMWQRVSSSPVHAIDFGTAPSSALCAQVRLPAGSFGLIGWSLGGFVALELAVRYPDRIKGLALGGVGHSFPLSGDSLARWLRLLALDPARQLALFDALLWSSHDQQAGHPRSFQQRVRDSGPLPSLTGLQSGLQYLQSFSLSPSWLTILRKLACPIHLYRGEEDVIMPASYTAALARDWPQATLFTWPATGHMACWTQAREIAQCIRVLQQEGERAGQGKSSS